MQIIYNKVTIGLKFRVNDFITMMTESNYATYRYLLRKVNICDESTDEINTAYQNIIHKLDPFFEYEQFLERITNVPTEDFGNVNILNYDCVLDVKEFQFGHQSFLPSGTNVKEFQFGHQSFLPSGTNVKTIPFDIMMQAMTEEISVVDGFDEPIDLSSLPPHEKVVSIVTKLIE